MPSQTSEALDYRLSFLTTSESSLWTNIRFDTIGVTEMTDWTVLRLEHGELIAVFSSRTAGTVSSIF